MPIDIKKLEHECFPQPQNPNDLVWRYMDLSKFIWLLDNKKLYLSRIDLLGDPHEGAYTQKGYELISDAFKKEPKIKEPLKHAKKFKEVVSQARFNVRKGAYVNCWYLNNFESEAMWKLYCDSKTGIAVQTTYQKLLNSVSGPDLFIGRVRYIDYESETIPPNNILYSMMYKRISFQHENEIRIVKVFLESVKDDYEGPPGIKINFDLDNAVENIFIHPYADEWYENVVQSVLSHHAPHLSDRMKWSKLKCEPFF
jgi:hypothetical protein